MASSVKISIKVVAIEIPTACISSLLLVMSASDCDSCSGSFSIDYKVNIMHTLIIAHMS